VGEVRKQGTVRHRKTATGRKSDVTGHIPIAKRISHGRHIIVMRYTGYDKKYSIFFKYPLMHIPIASGLDWSHFA
jgi:hypothetical protein